MPVIFAGVLLLVATSRWGSHLHLPVIPGYLGDGILLAALAQAVYLWRKGFLRDRSPRDAGWLGLFVGVFFVWSLLRFVTRTAVPLVAIRDLAPYAYSGVALLAFLLPVQPGVRVRQAIYAALTFHATWFLAVTVGVLSVYRMPEVDAGIQLFSTRPDFDSAVFAVAIAFGLHEILYGPRPRLDLRTAALVGFIALNGYGVLSQHSRAGLISSIVAVAVLLGSWLARPRDGAPHNSHWAKRGAVVAAVLVAGALALLFTLPGQRLVGGVIGNDGDASGTTNARVLVFEGVSGWLLDSPVYTAVGVGYGPNFLARSGTVSYLEGDQYENVRSPHNYLLGTWARLGLIGAALAAAIFVAAIRLALRHLAWRREPADVFAALLIITLPVVSLLGVVLESPFGAIPYFWAIGQVCATSRVRSRTPEDAQLTMVSAGAEG